MGGCHADSPVAEQEEVGRYYTDGVEHVFKGHAQLIAALAPVLTYHLVGCPNVTLCLCPSELEIFFHGMFQLLASLDAYHLHVLLKTSHGEMVVYVHPAYAAMTAEG